MKALFSAMKRSGSSGFTLVEIMIVVAIVALLAALALPSMIRARKRTQAASVLTDLRLIQSAVDQYALEYNLTSGTTVSTDSWRQYIKVGHRLYHSTTDVLGNSHYDVAVDAVPSVPVDSWDSLSDVVTVEFWTPFPQGS